ncbi:MAG TPA: protein phosphatase 2C domain-containing protein [Candidatus Paceibacterota bacterium]|nr:protein phosphatase 2C domain-containing protein [Candidatus Paceibacterota bacterium]
MQVFSHFELPSKKLRPQEDYLLVSNKYPIFIVADGVTLELNSDGTYPKFSGAGLLSKLFCETVIEEAEKAYKNLSAATLVELFSRGNAAARRFNESQNRTKKTINYWDFDLFAATTAFALIKNDTLYWWALCDSGIRVFDNKGNRKFTSPPAWPKERRDAHLPSEIRSLSLNAPERKKTIRRVYRNGLNEKGECIGYGVVTGEEAAVKYLEIGAMALTPGDTVVTYTDGFDHYLSLSEFIEAFVSWSDIEKNVEEFSLRKTQEDPETFGHERSLIAAQFSE